ncbi:MAG: hypothetical protein IKP88_09645 [Lachnospiraceae bacterium]|nr:hypothetical protein [Lachnospiraceae bacterium]
MSKIFFSDELIVVVPSYSQTEMHKHNMLHIFVGEEMLKMEIGGDIIEGKNIVLEQDVRHKGPVGKLNYFLFVDATSSFADLLRNKWLKTKKYAVINSDCLNIQEISEDSITQIISDFFGRDSLMRRATIDERITEALNEIDDRILFSGDCLAINQNGGYSLFNFFTQNPELNKKSLHRLKASIEKLPIEYVCTGHSGMHKMSDKIFAHIDESAKSTRKNPFDPTAPKSII